MVNKHFFKNQIFENGSLAAVLASGSTLKLGGKTQSILGSGMRPPTRCSAALLQQQHTNMDAQSEEVSFMTQKPNLNPTNFFTQPPCHPYLKEAGHSAGGYLFVDALTIKVNFSTESVMVFGSNSFTEANKRRRLN